MILKWDKKINSLFIHLNNKVSLYVTTNEEKLVYSKYANWQKSCFIECIKQNWYRTTFHLVINTEQKTFIVRKLNSLNNTRMYFYTFKYSKHVRTSCLVRMSILVGSESRVLGQRRALPFLGVTAIPRSGKLVSPPVRIYSFMADIVRVERTVIVVSEINIETLEPNGKWIEKVRWVYEQG